MTKSKQQPWYRRTTTKRIGAALLAIIILTLLAFRLSPWPGALVVRAVFDNGSTKTKQALQKHAPSGITTISNQQYESTSKDALLDVYYPTAKATPGTKLPVVVWTHGGGWLSGDKTNTVPYYQLIAEQGYVVIALNYSLAPGKTYPTQINQLNQAHTYIQANAERFYADPNKIFLAGDSAGAQLSAQLAAITTNPAYAQAVGITPSLKPEQLKGVILNCGIYQMAGLTHPNPTTPKIVGWGTDVTVWSYAGTRDFNKPVINRLSPYYYVTSDFPPTYISGGNADPLTNAQSKPLTAKLQSLGVPVDQLFYEANHEPKLPHEYQFNLDNSDGQNALKATLGFIAANAN